MTTTSNSTDRPAAGDRLSFSGHETFVFCHAWLKKAVDAVAADPTVFSQETAIVTLGVGKNMVRSIRHWALAAGVIAEEPKSRGMRLGVTRFGQMLLGKSGFDQYLEDPNTLWLLHWNILTQDQRCTTWNWMQVQRSLFEIAMTEQKLDRSQIGSRFEQMSGETMPQSVRMDLISQPCSCRGFSAGCPNHFAGDGSFAGVPAITRKQPQFRWAAKPAQVALQFL